LSSCASLDGPFPYCNIVLLYVFFVCYSKILYVVDVYITYRMPSLYYVYFSVLTTRSRSSEIFSSVFYMTIVAGRRFQIQTL